MKYQRSSRSSNSTSEPLDLSESIIVLMPPSFPCLGCVCFWLMLVLNNSQAQVKPVKRRGGAGLLAKSAGWGCGVLPRRLCGGSGGRTGFGDSRLVFSGDQGV
jgi:hypothetical protein